ncbi:MAG: hypothetical protein RI953_463 [Pseudomonadota bacterium]|jgi:hypothetical protein
MNLSLQEMVDAFERTSLDDRLFIVLKSMEELDVCIEFNRDDQLRCWTLFFREAREESSQKCSRAHFVEIARAFQIDDHTLSNELAGHLLTQAAFADQFVREIRELLGEDAVRESIVRTQLFMDALKDAVSSALEKAPRATSPASAQEQTSEPQIPTPQPGMRLRVIKGS